MSKIQNSKLHDLTTGEVQISLFEHLDFEFCVYLGFRYHFSILKKEFYESVDQKIHHKIPSVSSRNDLNPPLPAFGREKITKGGNPYLLPLAKGGREGFYKDFQNAKVLRV